MTTTIELPRVDKSAPKVQAMFGQIAGRYDLLNRLISGGIDQGWRRRTVAEAPPATTGPLSKLPILDVCCGTGDLALQYQAASPGVRVIGTDFTPEMLALTTPKQRPQQPIGYALADTLSLPFADEAFQIVCVAFGLRNLADTMAGLVEMRRVIAPGGTVAILECSTPTGAVAKRIAPLHSKYVVPLLGRLLNRNDSEAYQYLPDSVEQFPSGEALASMMTDAGYADVRFIPLTMGVVTLYLGTA